MKKIIPLLALMSCASYKPVTFAPEESVVHVYELNGLQAELFTKANTWMVSAFSDAASVIEHSDKEEGVILGKYLLNGRLATGMYGVSNDTRVFAMIDIRLKDNRARIEVKPTSAWKYDQSGFTIYDYSKNDAIADMEGLCSSFYKAMMAGSEDW